MDYAVSPVQSKRQQGFRSSPGDPSSVDDTFYTFYEPGPGCILSKQLIFLPPSPIISTMKISSLKKRKIYTPVMNRSSNLLNTSAGDLQGDQFNMTVFFWYLEKSDFSSVCMISSVLLESQGTRNTRPCLTAVQIHIIYFTVTDHVVFTKSFSKNKRKTFILLLRTPSISMI